MKKILVPADFSLTANNAAGYAMHLASHTKANVELCNAVTIPVEVPTVAQVSWPLLDIDEQEQEITARLNKQAFQLEQSFSINSGNSNYHPVVSAQVNIGAIEDVIPEMASQADACMVVMGMSGADNLTEMLNGGNSQALVEAATFPLLLIPAKAKFETIQKIAFATDLSREDAAAIHMLAGFARVFNAQILIVYISNKTSKAEAKCEVEDFLNDIANKINYPKIYYKCIVDDSVDHGLDWLTEFGQIQMLAMVHRKHNVLHKLFRGSFTQRLKRRIQIPLLVFPESCSSKVI